MGANLYSFIVLSAPVMSSASELYCLFISICSTKHDKNPYHLSGCQIRSAIYYAWIAADLYSSSRHGRVLSRPGQPHSGPGLSLPRLDPNPGIFWTFLDEKARFRLWGVRTDFSQISFDTNSGKMLGTSQSWLSSNTLAGLFFFSCPDFSFRKKLHNLLPYIKQNKIQIS